MAAEKNLKRLLKELTPELNSGEYVFVSVQDSGKIDRNNTICEFKEKEGITIVIEKNLADKLGYKYDYVASWITLNVHSSLEAVGLTAAISTELAKNRISCNIIAGYYHDHIFVDKKDSEEALRVLKQLSDEYK